MEKAVKDLVFFGIQGSGKGTQAQKLIEVQPDIYSYFSGGDIFRALMSAPNAIGDYVKKTINKWILIDDKVTIALFQSYFYSVLDEKKAMLLDGYPRTKEQVDDLFVLAERENRNLFGIQFDLSEEKAIERALLRWRDDDTEEGIRLRIKQYYEKTQPVIDYFDQKGSLIKINADQSIEEIFEDLKNIVL